MATLVDNLALNLEVGRRALYITASARFALIQVGDDFRRNLNLTQIAQGRMHPH